MSFHSGVTQLVTQAPGERVRCSNVLASRRVPERALGEAVKGSSLSSEPRRGRNEAVRPLLQYLGFCLPSAIGQNLSQGSSLRRRSSTDVLLRPTCVLSCNCKCALASGEVERLRHEGAEPKHVPLWAQSFCCFWWGRLLAFCSSTYKINPEDEFIYNVSPQTFIYFLLPFYHSFSFSKAFHINRLFKIDKTLAVPGVVCTVTKFPTLVTMEPTTLRGSLGRCHLFYR